MTYEVQYRLEAASDIQDTVDWFSLNDLGYLRESFFRRIQKAEIHLGRNPLIYPKIKHDIRSVHLSPFRQSLYFRVVGTTVLVLACQHHSRSPRTVQHLLVERKNSPL